MVSSPQLVKLTDHYWSSYHQAVSIHGYCFAIVDVLGFVTICDEFCELSFVSFVTECLVLPIETGGYNRSFVFLIVGEVTIESPLYVMSL